MNDPSSPIEQPSARLVLDGASAGICHVDRHGRVNYVNAAAAQSLGCSAQWLLGRCLHQTAHYARADGSPRSREDGTVLTALRQGRSLHVDGELMWRTDGTAFWADYSVGVSMHAGVVTGAVVSFSDISARRRAEEQARKVRGELEQRVASRTLELREALDELERVTERLRELSAHAEGERENDRSRIAREIHDELGSVLVALKLDLSWLGSRLKDRPELIAKTDSMRRLLDNAVVEVGRIITDLRPSILDHQGLWAAMEWHAQEATKAAGLGGRIDLDGVFPVEPPGGALATAAYRIFQEMLNNVARHAHATWVDIRVALQEGGLVIQVEDNGRGISTEALDNPRSYGLVGMYERARHFGGRVSIARRREGGTRVRAWLPFEPGIPLTADAAMEVGDDSPADL